MECRKFLWTIIVVLVALGSGRADAALLGLEATGAFGPISTLGGTAFGADTPYSFNAIFDPAKSKTFRSRSTATSSIRGSRCSSVPMDVGSIAFPPKDWIHAYRCAAWLFSRIS